MRWGAARHGVRWQAPVGTPIQLGWFEWIWIGIYCCVTAWTLWTDRTLATFILGLWGGFSVAAYKGAYWREP